MGLVHLGKRFGVNMGWEVGTGTPPFRSRIFSMNRNSTNMRRKLTFSSWSVTLGLHRKLSKRMMEHTSLSNINDLITSGCVSEEAILYKEQ